MSYTFTCNGKQGATVVLGSPGKQELVLRNQAFRKYVYDNHAYWYDFAIMKKHEVEPSDIILVSGFIKTSEWALNIFGKSSKAHEFSLSATVGDFVSADFALSADAEFDMAPVKRAGPPKRATEASVDGKATATMPPNQCLFLRYYVVSDRPLRGAVVKELPGRHTGQTEYADAMCCIPFCCLPVPSICRRRPRPRRKPKKRPVAAANDNPDNEEEHGVEMQNLVGATQQPSHVEEVPLDTDHVCNNHLTEAKTDFSL